MTTPTSGSGMLSEEERDALDTICDCCEWPHITEQVRALVRRLTADLASARALLERVKDAPYHTRCPSDCLRCEINAHLAGSGGAKEEAA